MFEETMCKLKELKRCANGSNIVALRFSDDNTKKVLGVIDSKV